MYTGQIHSNANRTRMLCLFTNVLICTSYVFCTPLLRYFGFVATLVTGCLTTDPYVGRLLEAISAL